MGMHLQEAYAPGGMSTVTRARSSLALSCVYGYGAPHPRPRAPGGGRFIGRRRALHYTRSGIRVASKLISYTTPSATHTLTPQRLTPQLCAHATRPFFSSTDVEPIHRADTRETRGTYAPPSGPLSCLSGYAPPSGPLSCDWSDCSVATAL